MNATPNNYDDDTSSPGYRAGYGVMEALQLPSREEALAELDRLEEELRAGAWPPGTASALAFVSGARAAISFWRNR
jgi:hypothetical protein